MIWQSVTVIDRDIVGDVRQAGNREGTSMVTTTNLIEARYHY